MIQNLSIIDKHINPDVSFRIDLELRKTELIIEELKDLEIIESNEGIITRLVASLIDVFLRIINNLKATVLGVFKALRRSELKSYIDAHKTQIILMRRGDYEKFKDAEVAIFPFNENKDIVFNKVSTFINNMNFKKRVDDVNNVLMNIVHGMLNKDESYLKAELKKLEQLTSSKLCSDIFLFVKKNDNTSIDKSTKFGNLFSSMAEFNKYTDSILAHGESLNTCIEVSKTIENKTYKILDSMVKAIQDDSMDKKITSNFISNLEKQIYSVGYMFDAAGHLFKFYSHMDHHVVNILKILKSKI